MSYPPAPWNLYGTAFQALGLVDLTAARKVVPLQFEMITVVPGKTVGGLYLASYNPASTLPYHELIVVAALVRYGSQIGGWISHIYVDHPESVQGGRQIWGLPKELATFTWSDRYVQVTKAETELCHFQYETSHMPVRWPGRLKLTGPIFSTLSQNILHFQGELAASLSWIGGEFTIPSQSPFSALNLSWPKLTVQLNELHLKAQTPTVVDRLRAIA